MQINNKTFCITTLGCRTNICESNIISDQLINNGAKITDDIDNADVCIVNTCCVTKRAEIKSHYFIKRAIRSPKCKLIVIVGCLPQISYKVFNHPKIGIILGTKDKTSLVNYIQKYERNNHIVNVTNFQNNDMLEKYQIVGKSNNTRAFMKIQDGCNFMCSYCIIPFVRGRQRSLPHNEIMKMIQSFVNKGYKEIVLTGVNTAGYQDKNNYKFLDLLKDIDNLDGNFRIRISSLEPFQINHTIIDLMTTNPKRWCQFFHICLQSASDKIIKDMKRKYSIKEFANLCKYIHKKSPYASITTDYIVGFPTETITDFKQGCKQLTKLNFSDMHLFPYSSRPFTPASKMKNLVSDSEKKNRFLAINDIRKSSEIKYLKQFINKEVNVLFEKPSKSHYQTGHSEYFFKVDVKTEKDLRNNLLKVKIIELIGTQLYGKLL